MRAFFTRRQACKLGVSGLIVVSLFKDFSPAFAASPRAQAGAASVLAAVTPPTFPSATFPITNYGAVGDGTTDNTAAFQKAIAACSQAGGGHVVVPAGTFLTGAIHLLSNVDLHLESGSTIKFSANTQAYLPVVYTRWQGIELMNYSPLIYAYGQQNVGVTGSGTLDGQASSSNWWAFKSHENSDFSKLEQMADQGVPVAQRVFGSGYHLPPAFIEPYNCQNVIIQGVTIKNSPFWQMHPTLCQNVTIDSVTADSLGPNNDGCDPECCNGVLIENCSFNTGDDCIALKAGRNTDGRRVNVPCQNVVIQNCTFADGHGGVTIGSEMTGGVQNVYAQGLQVSSASLEMFLRVKTNSVRGGFVKDITVDTATVAKVSKAVVDIDYTYDEGNTGSYPPTVTGITLSNTTIAQAKMAWDLIGYSTDPIGTVTLTNCTFTKVSSKDVADYVSNLVLNNVTINGKLQ